LIIAIPSADSQLRDTFDGGKVTAQNIVPGFTAGGDSSIPYVLGILADSIPMHDSGINVDERMQLGVVFNSDVIIETIDLLPRPH
jgi:hypothetical protein